MERIFCVGCSHRTAPLELRERLSLTERGSSQLLAELIEGGSVHEGVALSTCNRTELYLFVDDAVEAESRALGLLARAADIRPTELIGRLYALRGRDAVEHLMRVTSGLDSMVLGEAEIQGQVKRAFDESLSQGLSGAVLNRLFSGSLAAGKRVRSETGISKGALSVPAVAAELTARQLGHLEGREIVLVGAGETAALTAEALGKRGARLSLIANRRRERAEQLAHRFGGEAAGFESLNEHLAVADILITSTASPHHVLGRDELSAALAGRQGGPLLAIDLAVPRDIDPECRDLPGLDLFDMDDIQVMVERHRSSREAEVRRAEAVLGGEASRFEHWLEIQEATPTIAALRARGNRIAASVIEENEARWEGLTVADRDRVEAMTRSIVSRLLHEPTLRLKQIAGEEDAYVKVAALRELFSLDPETAPDRGVDAEVRQLRRADGHGE